MQHIDAFADSSEANPNLVKEIHFCECINANKTFFNIYGCVINSKGYMRRHMKSRLNLKPGQKGTKALVEKYGDAFVCVRYRYDEASLTRIKTVELIVEKKELPPAQKKQQNLADETLVSLRIEYGEKQLGKMARSAGVTWDPDVKLWYIRYGKIKGTELEKHII